MRVRSPRSEGEADRTDQGDIEYWLQRLIACCLSIGITKRALLYDYYLDEIGEIIYEHNEMIRRPSREDKEEVEEVYADGFF